MKVQRTTSSPSHALLARKDGGEALTGARMGRVLSRENVFTSRVLTLSRRAEGDIEIVASARRWRTLRGLRPRARADASRREPGDPMFALVQHQGRIAKSDDVRR